MLARLLKLSPSSAAVVLDRRSLHLRVAADLHRVHWDYLVKVI
jgi:hypothetical protein